MISGTGIPGSIGARHMIGTSLAVPCADVQTLIHLERTKWT